MASTIAISVVADASRAVRGFKEAADAASRMTGGLTKIGGALAVFGGNLLTSAASGLFGLFKDAVGGAQEAARNMRVLESQIHALGPAGQKAFAGASEFANQLSEAIGVDDDDIRAVEAKLASFPGAFKKGSLGAQGMERAIKAAFDLQAIGIGNAETNILQIGKALNDPVKGMTALTRAGVTFTDEQKKQIANAIKHNDLAKAQSILLQGIESNAKGAAAAAASPIDRMNVALHNTAEAIVGKMMPYIQKFADFVTAKVLPAAEKLADWLGPKISAAFSAVSSFITGTVAPVISDLWAKHGQQVMDGFKTVGGVLKDAFNGIKDAFNSLRKELNPDIIKAVGIALGVVAVAVILIESPILLVIAAIAALVIGFGYLYNRFATVREMVRVVGVMFNMLWNFIVAGWNNAKPALELLWQGIVAGVKTVIQIFQTVAPYIGAAMIWIAGKISAGIAFIKSVWATIVVVYNVAVSVFNSIRGAISSAMSAVAGFISSGVARVKAVWNGILSMVATVINVKNQIISTLSSLVGRVTSIGSDVVNGLRNGISGAWHRVTDWINGAINAIPAAIRHALGIGSPSRVMMEIGGYIGAGLAIGIQRSTDQVEQAVGALSSTVTSGLDTASSFDLALSTSGTATAGTGTIVLNVNVPVSSNPAEVGRQIVNSIRSYQSSVGRTVLVS